MTKARELAEFVVRSSFTDLSKAARDQLRICVLDALGCAIGALEGEPVRMVRHQIEEFGLGGSCSLIGGGAVSPERAALYNGALVRYLDYNDSFLAAGETCHPSDNVSAVLAASEFAECSGRDFLTALAVAYQVHCRLSELAPVRQKGFDHTTQGAYAVAAGAAKALGLDAERTANSLAICGASLNGLRITRSGELSQWRGLAYPHMALAATDAVLLAAKGVTGPLDVFEGRGGFIDTIAGHFVIDWQVEDLERINHVCLKKHDADIHAQSAVEAVIELQAEQGFAADDVERVEIDIFEIAYNLIGGGEEGPRHEVHTKEQADRSLPYVIAAALLDGHVLPQQYTHERISREDVQELLRKVEVRPLDEFSWRFPEEMPCRVRVYLTDRRVVEKEKRDYDGFYTRPMSWSDAVTKFERLATRYVEAPLRQDIIDVVDNLANLEVTELTGLLMRIPDPTRSTLV
ncbi:MAG: MmgE/PrpD family protein [Phycisphaerae bacterium]|nr:MmgE/PrpD family protein [Phycisphaerae bacterium]